MSDIIAQDLQNLQNGSNTVSGAPPTHPLPPPPFLPPLNTSNPGLPGPLNSPPPSAILSPGGSVRRAAPEPNKQALYVGGLLPNVTEDVLGEIFGTAGPVLSVKIIPDKTVSCCLCVSF